jgi:hypothetical protein
VVDYRSACLADDLVLRIRATRTTDCANNRTLVDQWNAASRRNDTIESEQIIEMHELDAILEDLRWTTESRGCSRLVFRYLDGGKHSAVHSLESNQVATGIGYCYVHLPIPLLRLFYGGVNNRLGSV